MVGILYPHSKFKQKFLCTPGTKIGLTNRRSNASIGVGGKIMGSLGSASNDSNAHDGNHWVWTRVTEPVLFEFGPCSQGTTSRSNCRSSAKMKMSDLVSKFGGDWQCSASTRSLYCSMTLECNASPRLPSLDTSYCSCHRIYQWMAKKLAMAPNCFQQLESPIFIRTRCTIVSYQFNLTLGQCE